MVDEFSVLINFVKLLDMPPSVVGALFGVSMYMRGKLRDKKYKEMESRVYDIHSRGKASVEVRSERDIEQVPLGAYKTSYKDAIKEVAFKIVLPCIIDKINKDKTHYTGKHYEQYIVDCGQDIHHSFVSALGRKVGITDFSNYIEEDALNEKVFIDMYGKIIRRAREKRKKII
jgi:hypothetical protein